MRVRDHFAFRLVACAALGFGLVTAPAFAAGSEQGALLIKGPGSVYAGQTGNNNANTEWGNLVTDTVSAGTAASYWFQVKNTGSDVARYTISIEPLAGSPYCVGWPYGQCTNPTVALFGGSLGTTKLAAGPNGYETAPIKPGAVATYRWSVTPAKTGTTPGDLFAHQITLRNTAGTQLGNSSITKTYITRTTPSSSAADQFVTTSGVASSSRPDHQLMYVASPTVKTGGTATWTVKITNNTPAAAMIKYRVVAQYPACSAYYPVTVKHGLQNVSSYATSGGYHNWLPKGGSSFTLTVSVKVLPGALDCLTTQNDFSSWNVWNSTVQSGDGNSPVGGPENTMYLLLNAPAT